MRSQRIGQGFESPYLHSKTEKTGDVPLSFLSLVNLESQVLTDQDHVDAVLMAGEACDQELTADGVR